MPQAQRRLDAMASSHIDPEEDIPFPDDDGIARLRVPPHSIEAEQSVLGSLLSDSAALGKISDLLTEADFYRHEHRLIYSAVCALVAAGHPVDVVTVFEHLDGMQLARDAGGISNINALAQSVPSAANIRRYAEIVAEKAMRRALIAACDTMATAAFNPPGATTAEDLLDDAKVQLGRIEQRRTGLGKGLRVLSMDDLIAASESASWLVKHVFPADSVGMIYGASGTFKSFLVLDAALHVAHGMPWMGKKTRRGQVLYIAAEGGAGLGPRIKAWHEEHRRDRAQAQISFVTTAVDLANDAWRVVDAAQIAGVAPSMVVVDTLSQTYSGDENSANEMAAYLREIGTRFRALWHCTVVLIHHTGHSETERPRGSSAIKGNLDFMAGVHRDEKELLATMTCDKQKDTEPFAPAIFSLKSHDLGVDSDGDRITSLASRHLATKDAIQEAQEAEKAAGRGGRTSLLMQLAQNGMRESELRKVFIERSGITGTDAQRQAYYRALKVAKSKGELEVAEGYILIFGNK